MSDRDLSVEKWLRQIPAADGAAEDCFDAESLASWVDGSLDGPARAAAEAHASNCARCQSMLAAMVQTIPAAVPAPERSPIRKWLMMLGPALGAAAAVALWFAVDQGPPQVSSRLEQEVASGASPSPAAAEPAKEAVAVPGGERDAAPPAQAAPVESAKVLADAKDKDAQPKVVADALSARQRTSPDLEMREAGRRSEIAEAKRAEGQYGFAAAKPSAPPAPPMPAAAPPRPAEAARSAADSRADATNAGAIQALPSPNQNQAANNQLGMSRVNQSQAAQGRGAAAPATQAGVEPQQRAEVVGSAAETVVVTATSPTVQTAASSVSDFSRLRAKDLGLIGNFVESAEGQARWRIASGRVIERSIDAGKTWSAQHLMTTANLIVAGASPTQSVCWLVGRGGLVLRTIDARVWQTVKFPESVDLISVTAADALVATVTTVDGRFFTTADGGATWVKQQ